MSPEDLTGFVYVGSPRISPDGSRIVFTHKTVGEKNNYRTNLWMVPTDGSDEPRPYTSSDKDAAPSWSPDGGSIAFISHRVKRHPQIHIISSSGGESRRLTNFREGSLGAFAWSPDGKQIAVAFRPTAEERTEAAEKKRTDTGESDPPYVLEEPWYRLDGDGYFGHQRYTLWVVDVETGERREIYNKDYFGFFTFAWSPDSRTLAVTTNRSRRAYIDHWRDEIILLDVRTKKIRDVPNLPEGPKTAIAWSPDGSTLAYAGREGHDSVYSTNNLHLYVCDPKTGNVRNLLAKTDYCMLAVTLSDTSEAAFSPSLRFSPDSKRIYMKLGWHGQAHIASVGRRGGAITFHTKGNVDLDLGTIDDACEKVAITRNRVDQLAEIGVASMRTDPFDVTMLTRFNQALLNQRTLAKITSSWVKTDDGTKVQVWCMLPPNHTSGSRKKYPAVLEIHGGPHAQYGVGFFHEFQVLAAAGYAVFFSNPRGSKGYGQEHCAAIRGDWGSADWVDMQAVIAHMKAHPNVDAKRMGVMGGSYGGYMTNWIIGHTNEFAGAITDRCVSNLVSMGGNSDFIDPPDDYFPGNFWDRPEARWQQSPIRLFGRVRTPTLIIHSEGDLRCNIEQSEQVFSALKLRKVPARFVRYPRSTSHGMSRMGPPDMRLHRLHEILNWWNKYLA
jgi:dipeptidyl aminopeptidase/acylaminoacyl peptidase